MLYKLTYRFYAKKKLSDLHFHVLSRFPLIMICPIVSELTDLLILLGTLHRFARQMIIVTKINGSLRDSPCIFSGSNGHVPPLIEGGRGVELPGEIRGNELKVTRARETFSSLSLPLSFLPSFLLFLLLGHHPRAPTELLTTTPPISPPSDNRVVNHHARHQYHRNQHALSVAIRDTKKRRERITDGKE